MVALTALHVSNIRHHSHCCEQTKTDIYKPNSLANQRRRIERSKHMQGCLLNISNISNNTSKLNKLNKQGCVVRCCEGCGCDGGGG